MTNNKKIYVIVAAFLVLAGVSALVFYFYKTQKNNLVTSSGNDNFIQSTVQAPAVEGNVINSGIAGKVILLDNKPFEASLDIFLSGNISKPFISIRTHSDGTFQVPLKPGSYILKPLDPDGPTTPVRNSYSFTLSGSQWLQVKIEYK